MNYKFNIDDFPEMPDFGANDHEKRKEFDKNRANYYSVDTLLIKVRDLEKNLDIATREARMHSHRSNAFQKAFLNMEDELKRFKMLNKQDVDKLTHEINSLKDENNRYKSLIDCTNK